MNTTGNPEGSEPEPGGPGAPQADPAGHDDVRPDSPGGEYGGEQLGEYGYTGGYGYGPGYGDPDGGGGYSYGPGYGDPGQGYGESGPGYAGQTPDAGQTPSYGGAGQRPSYGGDAGQSPSYGGDTGQSPSYGGDAGQRPSYGGDAGQRPSYGGDAGPGYAGQAPAGPGYAGQAPAGPGYAGQAPGYGEDAGPAYAGAPDSGGYGYTEPAGGYGPPPGGQGPAAGSQPAGGFPQAVPVVGTTPALKGYPGGPGLDTLTEEHGGPGGQESHGLNSPSVWQNAQRAWRDSGVEWQRPVEGYEPAEAEWERVRAAQPSKRRGGAGRVTGRPGGAGATAQPGAGQPGGGLQAGPGGGLQAGPLAGPPGSLTGTPGSLTGTPGSLTGTPGSLTGTPGSLTGTPGSLTGRPPAGRAPAGRAPAGRTLAGRTLGGRAPAARPPAGRPPEGQGWARPGGRPPAQPGGGARRGPGVWLIALGVVVVLLLAGGGYALFGRGGGKPAASPLYPPASMAGSDFANAPGQAGRGIYQSVDAVAASGGTVVAGGSQIGQWLPRTQFLVSANGGQSWQLATVRPASEAAATTSPAAVAPQLIAGGPGGWLALGDGTSWTSTDAKTWKVASTTGISPLFFGDRVLGLAKTTTGYIAVGENVPRAPAGVSPVVWTSADGVTWQRIPGSKLALPGGRALELSGVAAHGSDVVIYGNQTTTARVRRGKHTATVTTTSTGVWQSANGGTSWTVSHLPLGAGVASSVDGIASTGTGFVAIRPASSKNTGPDAVAYSSSDGLSWTGAGAITAGKKANLRISLVSGSDQGAVAVGQANGTRVVYVNTGGGSWSSVVGLNGPAQALTGFTVTTGGTVVAAGSTPNAYGQAPYLAVAPGGHTAAQISIGSIPGATTSSLVINGVSVAAGKHVAVGSADGNPAIWMGVTDGTWNAVSSTALSRAGVSSLNGVAYGSAGWVAAGGTTAGAPTHAIVVGSSNGTSWQAADGESVFDIPGVTLHAVAAGPGGYVVAGEQVTPATTVTKTIGSGKHKKSVRQAVPAENVAVAWWSGSLTGWTRAAGITATGPGVRQISAVTADGSGFVAVGSVSNGPTAWTSTNGKSWTAVPLAPPTGTTAAILQQVAVHGNLIVATGTAYSRTGTSAFAEYSTDGGTLWQQEPLTVRRGPSTVTALTSAAKGIVAVGTDGKPGSQHVVVWWTTNGLTWQTIQPTGTGLNSPGSQAITALSASGSALTGIGYLVTPASEQPTLWSATAGP